MMMRRNILLLLVLAACIALARAGDLDDDEDEEFIGQQPEKDPRKVTRGSIREVVFGSEDSSFDVVEGMAKRKQTPRMQLREASTVESPVLTFKRCVCMPDSHMHA
jgi:hypothetical protein